MIFKTESGTTYEVKGDYVRRLLGDESGELRRDAEWVKLIDLGQVKEGVSVVMVLTGLNAEGLHTVRTTSPVTEIEGKP